MLFLVLQEDIRPGSLLEHFVELPLGGRGLVQVPVREGEHGGAFGLTGHAQAAQAHQAEDDRQRQAAALGFGAAFRLDVVGHLQVAREGDVAEPRGLLGLESKFEEGFPEGADKGPDEQEIYRQGREDQGDGRSHGIFFFLLAEEGAFHRLVQDLLEIDIQHGRRVE